MRTKRITGKLLATMVALLLALTMVPAAAFAGTTGDDGAVSDLNFQQADNADATKVVWNGYTWDIIGYNYQGAKHGVASDTNNTATLLLDKNSYSSSLQTAFDSTSSTSSEYSGSTLQTKLTSIYNGFSDKSSITTRTLTGGSALIDDIDGYTGNTVAGVTVSSQSLWPLSTAEASQLKASVRSYGSNWWLRTPGYYSYNAGIVYNTGGVHSGGNLVDYVYSARPALYLNLTSSIFTSLSTVFSDGTLNIGAYDKTMSVTDSDGYTWDIIGVNDSANRGVYAPDGYATLLLSNSSAKKFGFPNQSGSYAGKTHGEYDPSGSYSNEYASSDLKNAMASAYNAIKSKPEYNGKIQERSFDGAATFDEWWDYRSEDVAGAAVADQGLWPLSIAEAETLSNQERIFGWFWWLRSPGHSADYAGVVYGGGSIGFNGYVDDDDSIRPALYLDLTSSIFTSLNSSEPDWQESVGSIDNGTYGGYDIEYTISFDSNGGSAVDNFLVAEGSAIGDLPTTTRAGYTFAGWWTAATGGSQINANTIPADNVTYYAHWDKIKYTITFNANKGKISKADAKKTIEPGKAIGKLPIPKRTGYTFKGWYTTKAAGTKLKATTKITANKTYYAHWSAKKYTVKLNVNGGKKLAASKAKLKVTYAKKYGKLTTPTKAGYKFLGWYTKKKGGTKITAKTTVKITKTTTLYAHWKKK
jgi:uncharacterized repeat protein (TIGR02543 family)